MQNISTQSINTQKTVVIGMSGGVDSSVSALLLKEQGYNVIGLFMHNWEEEENGICCAEEDYKDALAVCSKLSIPCYSVNFAKQYLEGVFQYFLSEYKRGRTPNPDVLCNREIKFGVLRDYAIRIGADYLATGHYCAIDPKNNFLLKAEDNNKDQTYFLNQVRTNQLDNVIFPLATIKKERVRELAEKYNLPTAKKKDSTGICFIGERKFKQFLSNYLPSKRGEIVDIFGKHLGYHDGLMYYTLGQRKGLGIGGIRDEENSRWYVVKKDLENNVLIVSCGEGEELLSSGLITEEFNWIGEKINQTEFICKAKFRYRQEEQDVKVTNQNDSIKIDFFNRQRAITEGQYAVLYLGNRCLGGAVIKQSF